VPPQHKKDFAAAFLKTKERVLRTNGGVKRVDLLEVRLRSEAWPLGFVADPILCSSVVICPHSSTDP